MCRIFVLYPTCVGYEIIIVLLPLKTKFNETACIYLGLYLMCKDNEKITYIFI